MKITDKMSHMGERMSVSKAVEKERQWHYFMWVYLGLPEEGKKYVKSFMRFLKLKYEGRI